MAAKKPEIAIFNSILTVFALFMKADAKSYFLFLYTYSWLRSQGLKQDYLDNDRGKI